MIELKDNQFFVSTPRGRKMHGFLKEEAEGMKFCRRVAKKDIMKIFQAWSINPEVLDYLKQHAVKNIHFKDEDTDYRISMERALEKGFEKTYSGGRTFYIPIKFWETSNYKQPKLL